MSFIGNESFFIDNYGNSRCYGMLADGRRVRRARLVMMNFLHTTHIPKRIHVHHKNGITSEDQIDNLELLLNKHHTALHNPRDYKYGVSRAEDSAAYDKAVRNHPDTRAKVLAADKKSYEKKKNDPHFKEVKKVYGRKYIAMKRKTDPVFREQQLEYNRIWLSSHKDEVAESNRLWREKHKDEPEYIEKKRIKAQKYFQENKEKIYTYRRAQRLKKKMEEKNATTA